ncbi:hypothetical protein, partial [Pontiella sp.]|uniref:hypothetical protein n=1 Tax=Pontiella sp. TaxID=2837462 RepID=UPI003568BD0F
MFKPFLAACTTLFVAGLAVVPSADAALHWSAQYQVDGPEPPPFDAGGFFPTGNGYSMYANSTSTNASGQYSIPALARFNTSGDLLWSVYMDAGQDSSDQELQAVFGNLDEFFAGYIDESNEVVKLSIYNTNLVAEYAVQFPVSAAEILNNSAQVSLDADDYATVLRNIGTTVKTLVLSETGAELVDKTFSSPLFSADTPGFVTQQALFDRLSGIDGYLLSVFIQRSFFDFSDPFNPVFGTTNTVVAVQLDDAGDINWATNFSLVSDLPVTPVQTLDENGNVVYILNDGIAGLGGQTNFAHVVKLNASGGLDWAKTIDDVVLTPARIVSSGVWISGTSSLSTNGTSDAVLLRLDGASGSLLAQATFDVGGADFASYAGGSGSEIFFSLNSYGFDTNTFSATNATGYVASADITLQNFTFREYTPTNSAFSLLWHDPVNSCLIYSPIVAASTNALTNLTVIALDENLATDAGCDFFDDAT